MYDSDIRICLVLSVFFVKHFTFNTKYKLIPPWAEEKNNMKKLAIASASLALAAVPVAGVFADATGPSFTDHLTVGVEGGCTLEVDPSNPGTYADRSFSTTIDTGTIGYLNATSDSTAGSGATHTVQCNSTTGNWTVSVAVNNDDGKLMSGTDFIAPGTTFSGDTSAWAIKSNATTSGSGTVTNNYSAYTAFSETTFLSASAAAGNSATFNPSYKVYVAPGQAVGSYTADVTYTVDLQ